MSLRRTGLNPLAYLGVEPITPPALVVDTRAPTQTDSQNFNLGTIWLVTDPSNPNFNEEIWMLVSLRGQLATWLELTTVGNLQFSTQGGIVYPFNENVNVFGGLNITTNGLIGPNQDTITIDMNPSITIPQNITVQSFGAGVITADINGLLSSSNGLDGQVLIGGGAAPQWQNITAGAGIVIVDAANSITISAPGAAGTGQFTTDTAGPVFPDGGGNLNVLGDNVITTDGSVANTVYVGLTQGTDGQLVIGATGLDPAWATIVSGDGSIAIATGPNTLDIRSIGVGSGAVTFHTDGADAVVDGFAAITIAGGASIITSGAVNTVTVDLDTNVTVVGTLTLSALGAGVVQTNGGGLISSTAGTDGQVLIGATAGAPAWATLTAGAGIAIANNANSITITNTGGGGGGGVNNFITNSGTAIQNAGSIHVYGDGVFPLGNIQTEKGTTVVADDTVIVKLNQSIVLPATNTTGSTGALWLGGNRFLHQRGTNNTFVGQGAGSFTLTTGSATANTGIGRSALQSITTGEQNTAVGSNCMDAITTGSKNTCIGVGAGGVLTTGGNNVAVGFQALNSHTTQGGSTAIGYQALKVATTSISNVMVGNTAGVVLATGAGRNVGVGLSALSAIVSGGYNTAVGTGAGSALTGSNSHNIMIGNDGVVGDSNVMRLGTPGNGSGQQNACYLAGVRSGTLGASQRVVLCDTDSKMGIPATVPGAGSLLIGSAGGSVDFNTLATANNSMVITNGANSITLEPRANTSYFQTELLTQVPNITGDNSIYTFGTTQAFTTVFNGSAGGLSNGGAGSPVRFTAPFNGIWRINANVLIGNLVPPPPPAPAVNPVCPLDIYVVTGAPSPTIYSLIGSYYYAQTSDPSYPAVMNYFYTVLVRLETGWNVTFKISIYYQAGTKTLNLEPNIVLPGVLGTVKGTFVEGNCVATF